MSTAAINYRLFYPDTNTLNTVNLYGPDGASVIPASIADGAGNPAGYQSKVITLSSPAELLLATPTFSNPASPVALYLCRDDGGGSFKKVLDESVFNPVSPGRPTAANNANQYLLYTATDLGGGFKSYSVKAPGSPVCIVKDAGKDPITGDALDGNVIMFRWSGAVPTALEVEADIEDITDPSGFFPVGVSNITTYAESSVGLSLIKADSQIVPQDGLGHAVKFRVRYNVNSDVGAWVTLADAFITYQMAAPNPPASLTVTLLRDRSDTIPDVVKLDWVKAGVNPGDGVEIYATDYLGKKHSIYSSNGAELTARVENISRFVVQDTGPAVARPYAFSIVATNISAKSEETDAAAPLNITSKVKTTAAPTPDELAGTAESVNHATFKAQVFANVLAAMGTLPAEGQNIVNTAVDQFVLKMKDVIRKGGSVTLDDFGVMTAKWTNERLARNPSTGAPIVVPAYRSLGFTPSIGLKTGTKNGTILTDAQAKAL